MATTGANVGLTVAETPGTTPWYALFEANWALLDGCLYLDVISRSIDTPPGAPANGARYHIGASPTGAWAGQAGKIAVRQSGAWVFFQPKEGWLMTSQADAGKLYKYQSSAFVHINATATEPEVIIVALGDETTALATGANKVRFRMPFAMTLTAVRASLNTASSSGLPTFDINEGGVSVLSTLLTIDASEKTSTTAATPAVISDASLADDAEISIDVDVAGTGAVGAKIYLIGTRT
jgi:hypothetical protein